MQSDAKTVQELIRLLETGKAAAQSNCIKALYEIGSENPGLIADHAPVFLALLKSKNNRLQWGAMTALDYIAAVKPEVLAKALPQITAAAKTGSVITKDHAVGILVKLTAIPKHAPKTLPLLLAELKACAANQFPMYAEMALPVVPDKARTGFAAILRGRLKKLPKASQQKRIEKLIRKITPPV